MALQYRSSIARIAQVSFNYATGGNFHILLSYQKRSEPNAVECEGIIGDNPTISHKEMIMMIAELYYSMLYQSPKNNLKLLFH